MDITWREESESLKRCILGGLCWQIQLYQPWMSKERAIAIRDRLINEILVEGFLDMPRAAFTYVQRYEKELRYGDSLLIK